jgi:hypothetical protein
MQLQPLASRKSRRLSIAVGVIGVRRWGIQLSARPTPTGWIEGGLLSGPACHQQNSLLLPPRRSTPSVESRRYRAIIS